MTDSAFPLHLILDAEFNGPEKFRLRFAFPATSVMMMESVRQQMQPKFEIVDYNLQRRLSEFGVGRRDRMS